MSEEICDFPFYSSHLIPIIFQTRPAFIRWWVTVPGDSVGVISVSTAHLTSPLLSSLPSDDLSSLILAPCPDSDQTRPGPGGPVQLSRSAPVSQQVSETRDGNITTILSFLSRPTRKLSSIFISIIFFVFYLTSESSFTKLKVYASSYPTLHHLIPLMYCVPCH